MYIQTDNNTVHLVELLLQKIENLDAKVNMLSNPVESAKLFNEDRVAELLDISKSSVITLRKEKKIHYRQIGNNIRYSLGDILEYEERYRR